MSKIVRFGSIEKDVVSIVRQWKPSFHRPTLVLPYEMLIFQEEAVMDVTHDFEPITNNNDKMFIVGEDRLYGFDTRFEPDSEIRLEGV